MARSPVIEQELTKQHGDLHQIIPKLVSEEGQESTARKLGVKQAWISRWLRGNGYEPHTQWIKPEERAS